MKKQVIQIMWHLNYECNLKCSHCYDERQSQDPKDRWLFQKTVIQRIVELQQQYRIIRVGLLGGEPLLDPNIIKIISTLYDVGIERVDIGTNGILINLQMVKELKRVNVVLVQVSLEGPTAEINDPIRGKNAFDKAISGLQLLNEFDIMSGIMTTVSKLNLHCMESMVNLALEKKVDIISFNRMLPLGRSKKNSSLALNSSETKQMISNIHTLDETNKNIEVSSDDPLLYVPMNGKTYTVNKYGGCGAGIGNLAICHDGTVFPCRRLPIKIGNTKNQSLIEIINSSNLDCFYNRGGYLKGKCGICDHQEICGGCRASALAFTDDHLNADPQCWHIPKERR